MLALLRLLALEQRHQDAERAEQAGGQVGDRDADAHRPLARQSGDRHQPAHALRDLVEARPVGVGPVLAEAGDAAVDDARVDLAQVLVVDLRAAASRRAGSSRPPRRPSSPSAGTPRGPPCSFRLSVMLRLLRCRFWKSKPSRGPPGASPPFSSGGISILMTLAPQSASCRTQVGPERTRVRSRTVKRASACEALGMGIGGTSTRVGRIGRTIPDIPALVYGLPATHCPAACSSPKVCRRSWNRRRRP